MMGYFKTAILMAGLTALFLAVGGAIGGGQGMMLALVFALGLNVFAWWNSDKMVLRMNHARPVSPRESPELYALVEKLAVNARIPMPALYVIDQDQPNAFATGRDPQHGAVAVTSGLLRQLDSREVQGVVAHEMAHIKNRDTLIMTMTATIAGAISMLANFAWLMPRDGDGRHNPLAGLAMMIVAPFAAMLVQMAISRSREYEADRIGAQICGHPDWLASALSNLHRGAAQIPNATAEANPATAHLFIVNPLHGHGADNLFSTHPSLENRVARLQELAAQMGRPVSNATPLDAASSVPQTGARRNPWA